MDYDVFICHATEDKDFVRQLATELVNLGLSVWYDEFALKVGSSITDSINRGISGSLYGVVVISPYFFTEKWERWAKRELSALMIYFGAEKNRLLPIWHNITEIEIRRYYPLLADIYALNSCHGADHIAKSIFETIFPKGDEQKRVRETLIDYIKAYQLFLDHMLNTEARVNTNVRSMLGMLTVIADALLDVGNTKDEYALLSIFRGVREYITSLNLTTMYCVMCRSIRFTFPPEKVTMRNGKPALKAKCYVCSTGMYKIGSK